MQQKKKPRRVRRGFVDAMIAARRWEKGSSGGWGQLLAAGYMNRAPKK